MLQLNSKLRLERIEPEGVGDKYPSYGGRCPDCNNPVYYRHDMKCQICDDKTIVWCPKCSLEKGQPIHWRVRFD